MINVIISKFKTFVKIRPYKVKTGNTLENVYSFTFLFIFPVKIY